MRRMILLLSLILTLTSMSGCQMIEKTFNTQTQKTSETAEGNMLVFYNNTDGNKSLSTPYVLNSTGDAAVTELFNILQNGQFSDGQAAVPSEVVLVRSAWQEHSLVLYLSGGYPAAGTVEEILCRYALVETMAQIPDVEGVTIFLDDEPLRDSDGYEIGTMTLESFLSDVNAPSAEEKTITSTVYFADSTGTALIPCQISLTANSTVSLERQVVERLIAGPGSADGIYPSIPSATKILGVNVHNNICYVNLNSNFVDDTLNTDSFVRVYSLINSLTALDEVKYVQLMINGAADFEYSDKISFAAPLGPDYTYVKR